MNISPIEQIGRALYGERWQAELARALQVSPDSVQDWKSGRMEPRPGVYADLLNIARQRQIDVGGAIEIIQQILKERPVTPVLDIPALAKALFDAGWNGQWRSDDNWLSTALLYFERGPINAGPIALALHEKLGIPNNAMPETPTGRAATLLHEYFSAIKPLRQRDRKVLRGAIDMTVAMLVRDAQGAE